MSLIMDNIIMTELQRNSVILHLFTIHSSLFTLHNAPLTWD